MFIFLIVWLFFDAVLGGNEKSLKLFVFIIMVLGILNEILKMH